MDHRAGFEFAAARRPGSEVFLNSARVENAFEIGNVVDGAGASGCVPDSDNPIWRYFRNTVFSNDGREADSPMLDGGGLSTTAAVFGFA
jgi:hypothetical protein